MVLTVFAMLLMILALVLALANNLQKGMLVLTAEYERVNRSQSLM